MSPQHSAVIITTPSPFDVIIGRGEFCRTHPGNVELNSLVACRVAEYKTVSTCKTKKSVLVSSILSSVQGRFLRQSHGRFEIIPARLVRAKIGRMLRDALAGDYRSSSVVKKRRRLQDLDARFQTVLERNSVIRTVLSQVQQDIDRLNNNNNNNNNNNTSSCTDWCNDSDSDSDVPSLASVFDSDTEDDNDSSNDYENISNCSQDSVVENLFDEANRRILSELKRSFVA